MLLLLGFFMIGRFKIIPEVLGKCYNLTDLNFERNALTFLPKEIGNLTALKKLNVEGNNLIQPPMEVVRMGIPAMVSHSRAFVFAAVSSPWVSCMPVICASGFCAGEF